MDNSTIEQCGMSFDRKLKLEYHLNSSHNKIDGKHSEDQESEQQQPQKFENEFFQEVRE